ncbi:MAG: O-antigen ligase family protein [Candidatus Theseobacter exili]|nr:O-antigen ligase family protein [Candidatus Theseobacter exili]
MKERRINLQKILQLVLLIGLGSVFFSRPLISGIVYPWTGPLYLVVLVYLWFLLMLKQIFSGKIQIKLYLSFVPSLGFLLFMAVSWFYSLNVSQSFWVVVNFFSCFLFFYLTVQIVENDGERNWLLGCFLASSCLVALYGLYQYFYGLDETRHWAEIYLSTKNLASSFKARLSSNRIFSTLIYPNALGGFLILSLSLGVSLLLFYKEETKKLLVRILLVVIIFSSFFCMLLGRPVCIFWAAISSLFMPVLFFTAIGLTFSKGAFLAACGSLMVLSYCFLKYRKRQFMARWTVIAFFFLVCLGIISFALPRSTNIFRTSTVRIGYWHGAVKAIMQNPWIGGGPGTFGFLYANNKSVGDEEETRMAHNDYLQIWSEFGSIAFVFYILFWIITLACMLKAMRKSFQDQDRASPVLIGVTAGLIGFFLHGFVDFDVYVPGISLCVWGLAGVAMTVNGKFRVSLINVETKWLKIFCIIAVFLLSAIIIRSIRNPVTGRIYRVEAMKLFSEGKISLALDLLKRSSSIDSKNAETLFALGRVLEISGRHREALDAYRKSLRYNNKSAAAALSVAVCLQRLEPLMRKDYSKEIIFYLNKAIENYPAKALYRLKLAEYFERIGKKKEAIAEYRKALERKADPKRVLPKIKFLTKKHKNLNIKNLKRG